MLRNSWREFSLLSRPAIRSCNVSRETGYFGQRNNNLGPFSQCSSTSVMIYVKYIYSQSTYTTQQTNKQKIPKQNKNGASLPDYFCIKTIWILNNRNYLWRIYQRHFRSKYRTCQDSLGSIAFCIKWNPYLILISSFVAWCHFT